MTQAEFARRTVAMQDTLYRVSCTILPQLCDREDAVQSAIEKALRKRLLLRNDDALEAWLTRILINECRNIQRKRKRIVSLDALPETPVPAHDPTLSLAMQRLPEKLRLPLALHYIEDMPYAQISQILHLPQTTIVGRIHRAKQQLRKELEA